MSSGVNFAQSFEPENHHESERTAPRIVTVTDEALETHQLEPSNIRSVELPFTVRLVRTEEHLRKAIQVRADAFLHHAPKLGAKLLEPEPADRARGNVILLAESKDTGDPEGSVRIETNAEVRTELESLVEMPDFLKGKRLAQVGRLGVKRGPGGTLVKQALFKSLYRYCLATQIDYLLIAARSPVDRDFIRWGFREVFEQPTLLSFPGQGSKMLRIFVVDIVAGERTWRQAGHPLYRFMVEDYHPDIEIFSSIRGMWASPRERSRGSSEMPNHVTTLDVPIV